MALLAVFAVFCSKLTAIEVSFRQKSWATGVSANEKTAEPPQFRLAFPQFPLEKSRNREGGNITENCFRALLHEICMPVTILYEAKVVNITIISLA